MPELNGADVATFTNGRLVDNAATQQMLAAALLVARRETMWHVSPVRTETVVLDGPDSRQLLLPTRKIVTLTSVEEKGTLLDLAKLTWSRGAQPGFMDRQCVVRKRSGARWTEEYGGIEVVMEHGYTEAEAADWRWAILSMVDQMSLVPVKAGSGMSEHGLKTKQIDDVEYQWAAPFIGAAEEVVYSYGAILCDYKLPPLEFL